MKSLNDEEKQALLGFEDPSVVSRGCHLLYAPLQGRFLAVLYKH